MATDVRGHTIPAGSDVFDPQGAIVATSLSINDIVYAANASDRTAKVAAIAPTTSDPVLILQLDTGVIYKHDGATAIAVTFADATDTGWVAQTAASGWSVNSTIKTRQRGRTVYARGLVMPDSGSVASGSTSTVWTVPAGLRPAVDYHVSACAWISGGTPVYGGAVCAINIGASTGVVTLGNGPDSAITGALIDGIAWDLD